MININKKHQLKENILNPFSLPPEITFSKKLMSKDGYSYVIYIFRHKEYGELGGLILKEEDNKGLHVSAYITGNKNDPETEKRKLILEPFFSYFTKTLEHNHGKSKDAQPLDSSYFPQYIVEDMTFPCKKCGTIVAMLIFAPEAHTSDKLEDYARLMYKKINELNVPTWVIGEVESISAHEGKALVLKLLPKKEVEKEIFSSELNIIIDELLENHCI